MGGFDNGYVGWGTWWVTLALINAGLAQTKHRDAWLTFVLSLVLGPIATLVTVLSRPRPEKSPR